MGEFSSRSVAVEGRTLCFAESGGGAALVVIDGLGGARPGRAQALLAETRRVLVFGLPDVDGDARHLARLLAAALDGLGLESFDLMGHGVGASVAMWLAVERPKAVRGLIVLAPVALDAGAAAAQLANGALDASVLHAHPDRHPAPPHPARERVQRLLGGNAELEPSLGALEVPVLALFATNDPLAPPEAGDRYRAALRDCNLMFVYDAAHLVDLDRPEAIAFIAGEFLGRKDQFLVSREDGQAFP